MTASNGAFKSSTSFSLTLQQASPRVSFVVLFVLSRSRWLPLLGWNLKMASVSSTSVRPPSVGCASPRSAMTVNPFRPLRFWRPLRRPVLFSPLRYDRSGYAHRFLMWYLSSVVYLLPPDLFRRFQQELGQLFHPLYVKALMALEEPVQWRGGNLVFFPNKGSSKKCCNAHREIAVSSVPGKLLHRWRRALVMPGLMDIVSETQCGGLAGRATDVASHGTASQNPQTFHHRCLCSCDCCLLQRRQVPGH